MSSLVSAIIGFFSVPSSGTAASSFHEYLEKKIDLETLSKRLQNEPTDYSQMLREFQAREIAEVLVRSSPASDVATQLLDDGIDILDLSEEEIKAKALDAFTDKNS
jgi:hypothetical protein